MPILTVAALTEAAKTYDPILRTLPFFSLDALAAKLKLNIQQVENEDVIVNMRRKAGGTGPYSPGMAITYDPEIAKFFESNLKPEMVVFKIKDNITNYKDKKVLVNAGTKLDLKTKAHPLEQLIVQNVVTSHAEDIVFALFHAERDTATFSPMTSFTGFYPVLDLLTTNGYIAAGQGNLEITGVFAAPIDENDSTAYDKLVEFIYSSHPLLRSSIGGTPQLICAQTVLKNARDAYRNKVKMFAIPTMTQVLEALREDAFCPALEIATDEALGTGSKLILQKVGNMDIGFDTSKAAQFMQVRNIYEDPNEIQFWLESMYGTRVRDVHKKIFKTNEQVNTRIDLSGDY